MTELKREACLIAGEWVTGERWIDVDDPATGRRNGFRELVFDRRRHRQTMGDRLQIMIGARAPAGTLPAAGPEGDETAFRQSADQ